MLLLLESFQVLLIENEKGEFELQSFVMPNQKLPDIKLKNYLVPLESIERAAGIHLFDKVPRNSIKRINAGKSWLEMLMAYKIPFVIIFLMIDLHC